MDILFLTHYFPPEVNAPASRTYEHSKVWSLKGHSVTVITCTPNHPYGTPLNGYANKLIQVEYIDKIKVYRVYTFITPNSGLVLRTVSYLFYLFAATVASCFIKRPDIVISTSPQFFCGLAGYFVSRIKGVPWVLEIRDLWPEAITAVGQVKSKTIITPLKFLAKFSYHKADHIVSVTDGYSKTIQKYGIDKGKISVVPNGVEEDLFFSRDVGRDSRKTFNFSCKQTIVGYIGTHGQSHGLETILLAAETLISKKDIQFVFVGEGSEKLKLQKIAKLKKLHNVHFFGAVEKQRVQSLLKEIDFGIVPLKALKIFEDVVPSKIFELMLAGKPILLGVKGEAERIIKEADAGITFTPQDYEMLANKIIYLHENKQITLQLGNNGKKFVRNNFNRKNNALNLLEVLKRLKN